MRALLMAFLVFLMGCGLFAETMIPAGPVSGNWTAAGSPYLIMGNITINNLASLTVGPGVDVVFQGTYRLDVLGQIVCNGDVENNVTFTAADTLTGWQSIRFNNSGTTNPASSFTYTNFYYGKALNGSSVSDPLNSGGAVYAVGAGTLTFNFCRFVRCMSAADGSAVYADGQTNLDMNDCLIKDCEASWFGGIFLRYGTGSFTNCSFFGNSSNVFGAAMYIYECPTVSIVSCSFQYCWAGAVGGIYSLYTPLGITNSLFQGNYTVTGRGGAIGVTHGTALITNCTFAGNSSAMDGGAIWLNVMDTPATITNTIFWDNTPDAIINVETTYTLSYCSTQVAQGGATNIWGNPLFTNAEDDDYTLSPASPCIDAGTPDVAGLNLPAVDLAGMPRIVDGDGDSVLRIDMGCFEAPPYSAIGQIIGQVIDASSQPVSGATITAGTATATTDTWGLYTLSVEAGVYSVSCSKPGYQTVTQDNVTVTADQITIVNFTLETVSNSDPANSPQLTRLASQPNPFAGDTRISWSLDKGCHVALEIYNLKGQKVRALLDADLSKGEHSVAWNGLDDHGRQLGSGMYLARIHWAGEARTTRLIKF